MAKTDSVTNIPAAELADIIEGHPDTKLETNTVVEDRTEAPVVDREVEYDVKHEPAGNDGATVLTTYGDPVSGFPAPETSEAAE
jgi:hypothetical protein